MSHTIYKQIIIVLFSTIFFLGCSKDDTKGATQKDPDTKQEIHINLKGAKGFITTGEETKTNNSPQSSSNQTTKTSNLLRVNEDGSMEQALSDDSGATVLYTLFSQDSKQMYIVFDGYKSTKLIADNNCTVFQVSVDDNNGTLKCLDQGFIAASSAQNNKNRINLNRKPLQYDNKGNLYYIARPAEYTINCPNSSDCYAEVIQNQYAEGNTVIRKISSDGTVVSISPTGNDISTFTVMKSGTIVYEYIEHPENNRVIKMYSNGESSTVTNQLYSNQYYAVDDLKTVLIASNNSLSFIQKHPVLTGTTHLSQIDLSIFADDRRGSIITTNLLVSDDGKVYITYVDRETFRDKDGNIKTISTLRLYQALPFNAQPKATFVIDEKLSYRDISIEISDGYVYFVNRQTNTTTSSSSTRDVLEIVRLDDGTKKLLFSKSTNVIVDGISYTQWLDRLDIQEWRLANGTFYFLAFDNVTSKSLYGEVDTKKFINNKSDFLLTSDTKTFIDKKTSINDIEIVPKRKAADNISQLPKVVKITTDPENLATVSILFNKRMNSSSVESSVSIKESGSSNLVNTMVVWFSNRVHLILDTKLGNTTTDTLAFNTEYTVDIDKDAKDLNGVILGDKNNPISLRKKFITRDIDGWIKSSISPSQLTDGHVARHIKKEKNLSGIYIALDDQLTTKNIRLEFSLRGYYAGEVRLREARAENIARSENVLFSLDIRYGTFSGTYINTSNQEKKLVEDNVNIYFHNWKKGIIDFYGDNLKFSIEDGSGLVQEVFNVDDYYSAKEGFTTDGSNKYKLDFIYSPITEIALDNIILTELNDDGSVFHEKERYDFNESINNIFLTPARYDNNSSTFI